jgi:hypothetical protein
VGEERRASEAINAYRVALTATERRLTKEHPLYKIISDRIRFLTKDSLADGFRDGDVANGPAKADIAELKTSPLQPTHTW